jgi:hypothetical protein
MAHSQQVSDLYFSPNGDRWLLGRRPGGELVVCHFPNQASGGAFSETDVDVFLRQDPHGPEHQALVTVLATLDDSSGQPLRPDAIDELLAALGQAVVRHWSSLSAETQHDLFEAAILASGETLRPALARYLHERHQRTLNSLQEKAIAEPDSLGG